MNGWTARVLIALSIGLGACGAVDPEVGEDVDAAQAAGGTTACVDQDSDLESGVTWMMLKEQVLAKRCGCHTTPGGLGVTVTGLDLATRDGALKGGRNTPDAIVPSDPCASVLLAKVDRALDPTDDLEAQANTPDSIDEEPEEPQDLEPITTE